MTNNDLVPELTNGEFEEFSRKKGLSVLDFFAEWCMPCTMMSPIVDSLAEEFKGKANFGKINVEDNPEIASKFEINSIPSFVFLKNGEIVDKFIGSKNEEEMSEIIKKHL